MSRIKPIGAWLARSSSQRSQSKPLERAGPDLPVEVSQQIVLYAEFREVSRLINTVMLQLGTERWYIRYGDRIHRTGYAVAGRSDRMKCLVLEIVRG